MSLTPAESDCLKKVMNPNYTSNLHLIIEVCKSLEQKGLFHIITDKPDYWAVAQTPEEADAARCILIPGYKPKYGPEWLSELEKASTI